MSLQTELINAHLLISESFIISVFWEVWVLIGATDNFQARKKVAPKRSLFASRISSSSFSPFPFFFFYVFTFFLNIFYTFFYIFSVGLSRCPAQGLTETALKLPWNCSENWFKTALKKRLWNCSKNCSETTLSFLMLPSGGGWRQLLMASVLL